MKDDSAAWAHWMHSTYPRRAENELPPKLRANLERIRREHAAEVAKARAVASSASYSGTSK